MSTVTSSAPVVRILRLRRMLLAGAAALVLTTSPATIGFHGLDLDGRVALARGGDGGGGNGGGGGGNGPGDQGGQGDHGRDASARGGHDRGPGERGRAYGHERGQGGQGPNGGGYHDLNEFVDSVRNGRAVGLDRRDERVDRARDRYSAALEQPGPGRSGSRSAPGQAAHHFSPEETQALVERGWKGPAAQQSGFRNHGERVSTMVELSKQLGYGARVGALQANFGTPYENGIASLQEQLDEARAAGDAAEVERLEGELAEAIAGAKPGIGPEESWASADLDVNDDQVVDQRDLEALEQSAGTAGADDDAPAG